MATHTVKHEVHYDGAWQDVTSEVHEPSNTQISRGLTQFGDLKHATIAWQFEDPTAKWVPGNPMSPLYGKLGRALPCRVTVDGSVRAVGEAAVFSPDRTEDFQVGPPRRGRQWVDFRADGLIARINSWTEPLRSPMYRMIARRSTLVGHWPGEDGREAGQLSNTVAGGAPATARLVDFDVDDCPAGASSAVRLTETNNTSRIDGTFLPASTTAGWQFAWSMKLPALPGVTTLQVISWRCSNGYRWLLNVLSGLYQWKCLAADGTLLKEVNVSFLGAGEPDQWVTFRMKATASGGTVTAEFAWYVQGQSSTFGTTDTFAGTLGRLVSWTVNGNAYMDQALISHVFGVTGASDDLLDYATLRAFDGYVGELAADRFTRLLDEEGIAWSLIGDAADTMPMGRQVAAALGDHLQEIANTDRCLVYDARTTNAVELRTRVDLYRQTPVAFTYPGDIAPPFNERYDYVGVANRVTVSQRDGGEATAALESGAMSVQPAPDGIGERKAGVDVNVADEAVLPLIAGWELAQGTAPGPRFPEVTFDLDGTPGIAATVAGIEIGDRITITGFRYDTLDLLVLGIREFAQRKRRKVTLVCVPGTVFSQVGAYDSTTERYDLASSTLKTSVNATATALTFRTTDTEFESWSTSSTPYDVVIAGERIRVTAMGAPALVSGAYDQAATVTRSINGVVKSLTAGDEVHIATPGRYAL
jgi:hypothetical protein